MIEERPTIMEQNIRVAVIGRRDEIPEAVLREMRQDGRPERRATPACGCAWRSTTAAGRSWSTPCARSPPRSRAASSSPPRSTKRRCGASLHGRHARPRPADPHGRRDAGEQLPALADQLRGDLGHRALLARVSRERPAPGDPRLSPPATAASAA